MLILSSQKLNNTLICTNGILITAQNNKLRKLHDHNIIQDFVNLISHESFQRDIMAKNVLKLNEVHPEICGSPISGQNPICGQICKTDNSFCCQKFEVIN